jgi:hypothetical protein
MGNVINQINKTLHNSIFNAFMIFGFMMLITICFSATVNATAVTGFDAGRIIDDSVFTNSSSMDVNQIQVFLNSKTPNCDTNGTQPASDFGRSDLTHAQYAATRGWPAPPYPCLKDYHENGLGSAQIIYNAALQHQINPQVLIVLLQKEQGLVTDTWPLPVQYRSATGYGCPDTAPCDSQYYGLTNQLQWSAHMFRSIMDNNPGWYTPYVLGNNYILWSPNAACGGSTVNIQNRATQSLYNYTPYQPNQASLNAGYGTGDSCSSHGNRNFYLYFSDWFGGTTAAATYSYSVVSKEFFSDASYQTKISDTPTVEPNSALYFKLIIRNTGNQIWYNNNLNIGGEGPKNRSSEFVSDGWHNAGRPASMNEASVSGGGTATFTFKMTAPSSLGQRQEQFGILIEGNRWLDGIITLPINVASSSPIYSAQTVSFDVYADSAMTNKLNTSNVTSYTGSKIYVKTIIKNTGNQILPANDTKIGTTNDRISSYADESWMTQNRVTHSKEGAISPGGAGTFTFSLTAPNTQQARTQEQFGLLVEGQDWYINNLGTISIQTINRPPSELLPNQSLRVGDSLLSYDEKYRLILQGDGNLVLYSPTRALWSTATVGRGGMRLILQTDGNLVLYRSDWVPVWDSRTDGQGSVRLIPQTDGNLVLYTNSWRPTWYTAR